jgi:hypothetical protein
MGRLAPAGVERPSPLYNVIAAKATISFDASEEVKM